MYRNRSKNPALAAAMAVIGKTGQTLARECGIHPVTFSHLLNNRTWPKPRTAKLIAKALNVKPEKLFPGFKSLGGET